MPTPNYVVLDADGEECYATGASPEAAVKDLITTMDADSPDSWEDGDKVYLYRLMGPLTIERRPDVRLPSDLRSKAKGGAKSTAKRAANGRKPSRSYKSPGTRRICAHPECGKGFISHKGAKFHSKKCNKHWANVVYRVADNLAHSRSNARLRAKYDWIDTHAASKARILRLAERIRTKKSRGTTIVRNTPTASKEVNA